LAARPKADLVIVHGMVWTGLSTGRPQPGVVAVRGDRILAVGDSATVARFVSAGTKVLDARGGLVMPGFADAHTHFVDGGFQLASLDLRKRGEPTGFVRRVKEFARGRKPGEWIVGGDWDQHLMERAAAAPSRMDRLRHARQSGVHQPARRPRSARQRGGDCAPPKSPRTHRRRSAARFCATRA